MKSSKAEHEEVGMGREMSRTVENRELGEVVWDRRVLEGSLGIRPQIQHLLPHPLGKKKFRYSEVTVDFVLAWVNDPQKNATPWIFF